MIQELQNNCGPAGGNEDERMLCSVL